MSKTMCARGEAIQMYQARLSTRSGSGTLISISSAPKRSFFGKNSTLRLVQAGLNLLLIMKK